MGKNKICCVGNCDNDEKYTLRVVIKPHMKEVKWHRFPSNAKKIAEWTCAISKGRKCFKPGKYTYVCSNHFMAGKPGDDYGPRKLYLTKSEDCKTPSSRRSSPRRRISLSSPPSDNDCVANEGPLTQSTQTDDIIQEHVPMMFAHITRESDVRFFTGITGPELFKEIFDIMLEPKAKHMTYWSGVKKSTGNDLMFSCDEQRLKKRGPLRKLG